MKKTYIQPQAFIEEAELEIILAGSAQGVTVYEDVYADPNSTVLSRRSNSVWDDDEE